MVRFVFEGFSANAEITPFAFNLLDTPAIIQEFPATEGTELVVFALATTTKVMEGEQFIYALALIHVLGCSFFEEKLLVIRTQERSLRDDTRWEYNPIFFSRDWVQRWFSKHPNHLVHGGAVAARALQS